LDIAAELVAPRTLDLSLDHIQIALNYPPWDHRPGGPHVDGHRPDQRRPDSFTMLAAIYLVDEQETPAGNLWVWPGSHLDHERLFRQRGTRALLPVSGHSTMLDPPPALREQVPVLATRGDLLLAHYLLGHNTGGNTTDRVRRIAYYRLGCPGHEARWEETFLDAFVEYSPVRRQLAG
jgi:ectoine hydroxylase-related dioxygenase (phytanoyl-CoA dioxygenase family)